MRALYRGFGDEVVVEGGRGQRAEGGDDEKGKETEGGESRTLYSAKEKSHEWY